jgi:translation initiation factor 2 alpha subunit (eIF-2alpha)
MKHYTAKQINQIKQEIRTGKPVVLIAEDLAKEWGRPLRGIYSKVLNLSKQTRKITNTYTGSIKRRRTKKAPRPAAVEQVIMNLEPLPGSLMQNFDNRIKEIIEDIEAAEAAQAVHEICEEIVSKPIERQPAEIGIEVPVGTMAFTGVPSKIVVYQDHVRYYFDN